jgi:hypothetical protein
MKADKDPAPLTVEEEQAKVAKMRATRAARHTMGPPRRFGVAGQARTSPARPLAPRSAHPGR